MQTAVEEQQEAFTTFCKVSLQCVQPYREQNPTLPSHITHLNTYVLQTHAQPPKQTHSEREEESSVDGYRERERERGTEGGEGEVNQGARDQWYILPDRRSACLLCMHVRMAKQNCVSNCVLVLHMCTTYPCHQ